jgi:hypothetical protein
VFVVVVTELVVQPDKNKTATTRIASVNNRFFITASIPFDYEALTLVLSIRKAT